MTPAQTKMSTSGKCGKPDTAQSVTAADKDGHVFMIASGKCETVGKVAGATSKEAAFAEHSEVTGDHMRTWGVFAETFRWKAAIRTWKLWRRREMSACRSP